MMIIHLFGWVLHNSLIRQYSDVNKWVMSVLLHMRAQMKGSELSRACADLMQLVLHEILCVLRDSVVIPQQLSKGCTSVATLPTLLHVTGIAADVIDLCSFAQTINILQRALDEVFTLNASKNRQQTRMLSLKIHFVLCYKYCTLLSLGLPLSYSIDITHTTRLITELPHNIHIFT